MYLDDVQLIFTDQIEHFYNTVIGLQKVMCMSINRDVSVFLQFCYQLEYLQCIWTLWISLTVFVMEKVVKSQHVIYKNIHTHTKNIDMVIF